MCGIAFAYDYDGEPVNNGILNLYDKQSHRGQEGFGYYDGEHDHLVHAAQEARIINQLCKTESSMILFHHRRPTSTINVKRAAHPFTTKTYFGDTEYILIHNGHISNSRALKLEHEELGIKYHSELQDGTFNDSESLLWDLSLTLEGKQDKLKAYGGIAFICLKREGDTLTKLFFGRNTNPLMMYRDKNGLALASETLDESIDSQTLYTFNIGLKRLTSKLFSIPSSQYYPPYTPAPYTPGQYTPVPLGYQPREYQLNLNGGLDRYDDEDEGYYPPFAGSKRDDYYNTRYDDYEDEDEWIIGDARVEDKALEYLITCRGNIEASIDMVEEDYEQLFNLRGVPLDPVKARLLERVASYLANDPEYLEPTSVSSMWRALWDK